MSDVIHKWHGNTSLQYELVCSVKGKVRRVLKRKYENRLKWKVRRQRESSGKCPPEMHVSSPFVSSRLALFPSSQSCVLHFLLDNRQILNYSCWEELKKYNPHTSWMCAQRLGSRSAIAHLDVCVCVVSVLARLLSLSSIKWEGSWLSWANCMTVVNKCVCMWMCWWHFGH